MLEQELALSEPQRRRLADFLVWNARPENALFGTMYDNWQLKAFPLPRLEDGDKESKGRILILAGSRQVPGAALLCATAAMRSGGTACGRPRPSRDTNVR